MYSVSCIEVAWEIKKISLAACFSLVHFKLHMEEMWSLSENMGARTLNSWRWRIVSLISATISSLFILSIFIFFTFCFSISFLWYVNIVTVYYYICILYLPSPLLRMNQAGLLEPSWDVTEHLCMWTHAIKICKQHYRSVLFPVPFVMCHRVWRLQKKGFLLHTTRHVSVMNYNPVRRWNFTVSVRQASIADLTIAVNINGLLLSVLLLHCVDFVIWNKCMFSFCMFFTMLKVAAVALIIIP